jgi:hypothetical protein
MADNSSAQELLRTGKLSSLSLEGLNRVLKEERVTNKQVLLLGLETHLTGKRQREEDDKVCGWGRWGKGWVIGVEKGPAATEHSPSLDPQ